MTVPAHKKGIPYNLTKEHEYAREMLLKAKRKGIKLIATDLDGTVLARDPADGQYEKYHELSTVVQLASDVTQQGAEFAILSARNTTLEVKIREIAQQFSTKKRTPFTIWRSGGNGMNLFRLSFRPDLPEPEVEPIYVNEISIQEAHAVADVFQLMYAKLSMVPSSQGVAFFRSFLSEALPEDLVPVSHRAISDKYGGAFFAEGVKVSCVLPDDIQHQRTCIDFLHKHLDTELFHIGWSRSPFADISKVLKQNDVPVDGKDFAVSTILARSHLNDEQVITFGDAPTTTDGIGNDTGLLRFPFSFTSCQEGLKSRIEEPPYILAIHDNSPVASVHSAIRSVF
ncbi:hypothetical protein A3H80_04850 [Candidatus Roizmanbacteria bacterium RIFCSPLOWO2_02_FULL_37_19]|uniref:Sucrose phosphatase-like domain-containing protein n=1 Tax=Candidatus Roizmanbacteria bacterium RIFCSPHIGHO2_02_FULL_37_24 TaxID=1802037 RepID=A0A1F7GVU7_9BACT|nr:MAG: hypothetical protein A2862_02130 [Candidatus Roizmanbacteria bacterium RIFCSPHIGHO2_01_FULL_38_41]OGK23197.1 MAG: hypothetical protein A3C24_00885 [Candidatus Roizmanbacteria bacterium RIFCSPHIGHO2_02_FULL_37_24]OGK32471.1 MAG: hypothetical protein A3E10_01295 [Candidatus Roizmanbacteria bacterium RIFCSPHIGHO2_12_FULL_37_23]OGK43610.1 MAG: hypothetical protein A2956_04230 [Candidatus Roizmanbacteria bacterium RIFCSPLOWO2_01_FULL_37_57]OGK54808.1 MAG: hypothetical protein A3H80_04850 [Ca